MRLEDVLVGVEGERIGYDGSTEITAIEYDSRKVRAGALFAALQGEHTDGNKYISQALANGANFILTGALQDDCRVGQVVAADTRRALRRVAENFYAEAEKQLKLVAITGTNGKTTIAQLIASALRSLGRCCGGVGTVEYDLVSEVIPAPLTTPESPDFQRYLRQMADSGAEYAVCEFSSQALVQERVVGENVDFAVFTNLSRDHLDNHGSMENYFLAKKLLFDHLAPGSFAVINSADPYAEKIVADSRAKVLRVGSEPEADIRLLHAEYAVDCTCLHIAVGGIEYSFDSALIGEYNAVNLLEAIAVLYAAGLNFSEIIPAVRNFKGAGGRLERFDSGDGRIAFVDYAHTDAALYNALSVLKKITPKRLIVVFGCGGDRDRGKRPLMAQVAEENADLVVLTNDNPRTEDPTQIMADILAGIRDKSRVQVEYDRKLAIQTALASAERGDVVLIAGKGHEDYQIIGGQRIHLDDREVVANYYNSL